MRIVQSDTGELSIRLYDKHMLGSRLCARIGKEEAILTHVERKTYASTGDIEGLWILQYEHPRKPDQTFEGHIKIYKNYIIFEIKQGFDFSVKKNKSIYGNPYISFPSFEGEEWYGELYGMTFKRQAPFNYPVWWEGKAVDCLREGKNIPFVLTTKSYETVILSPLDPLLHATVSVTHRPARIRCGIPQAVQGIVEGYISKTLLVTGKGVHQTWMQWGEVLRNYYGVEAVENDADRSLEYISYWTNAGSAYWYNNGGYDSYESVFKALNKHHQNIGIEYGSYEMDSWWYHKDGDTYTAGIVDWTPKSVVRSKNFNAMLPFLQRYKELSLFVEPSFEYVQSWLNKPIGCHYKQLAKTSIYVKENPDDFLIDSFALPKNQKSAKRHFKGIFSHPDWQLSYVIHDWLQLMNDRHEGFKDINIAKGYLTGLDEACQEIKAPMNQSGHLGLQLCMTQPHMTLYAVAMQSVSSIRSTSDSESFFVEGTKRWWWHLFSSHYIQALGKYAFYDQRHSKRYHWHPRSSLASFELIWLGLSCGPIGIGDAIGKEEVSLLKKAIVGEGRLIKPDYPAAPLNQCYVHCLYHMHAKEGAIVQTQSAWSSYGIYYALLFGLHPLGKKVEVTYSIEEFHDEEVNRHREYICYDYVTKACDIIVCNELHTYTMRHGQYHYHILAPIVEGKAFVGDVTKHVTAGRQLVVNVTIDTDMLLFEFTDRSSKEEMEWVCYTVKEPSEVRVDGKAQIYIWEDGKLTILIQGRWGSAERIRQCQVLFQ